MAGSERWKPVLFAFIFSLGFFVFSQAPFNAFASHEEESTEVHHIQKRSLNSENSYQLDLLETADALSLLESGRLKSKRKISNRKTLSSESEEKPKKFKRRKFNKNHHLKKKYPRASDSEEYNLRKYHRKRTSLKLVPSSHPNSSLLNPKPPLNLPIVKPEMLEENPVAKIIPTKGKPFHFHIPIISSNPQPQLELEELVKIAKEYKDPLNYDPVVIQAAAKGQILTAEQLSNIKRMVRDSPVLDFLNLGAVLSSNKRSAQLKEESNFDEELMGYKRNEIHMTATDEIMQEIVGDQDDLIEFEKIGSFNAKTKGRAMSGNDELKDLEETVKSDLFDADGKLDENAIRRKRQGVNFYETSSGHKRVKRGFGNWIKNLFGKGKKKTTTTEAPTTTTTSTTKAPKKKSKSKKSSSESDSSSEENSKKSKKSKKKSEFEKDIYFMLKVDKNGDTEVDKLLPKELRRSFYLKKKKQAKKREDDEDDSFEKEPIMIPVFLTESDSDESISDENDKKKKRRTKRNLMQPEPDFNYGLGLGGIPNKNPVPFVRFERSTDPFGLYSSSAINVNYMSSHNTPSATLSKLTEKNDFAKSAEQKTINLEITKDELKIVNEILSNIILKRCFSVREELMDKFEQSLSALVDQSSNTPEMIEKERPEVYELLGQMENCSSDAVKILLWKSEWNNQQKILKSNSHINSDDFETGGAILRTKRISTDADDSLNNLEIDGGRDDINRRAEIIPNILDIVLDGCRNVDSKLLKSAGHILKEIIQQGNIEKTKELNVNSDNAFAYGNKVHLNEAEELEIYKSVDKCMRFTSKKKILKKTKQTFAEESVKIANKIKEKKAKVHQKSEKFTWGQDKSPSRGQVLTQSTLSTENIGQYFPFLGQTNLNKGELGQNVLDQKSPGLQYTSQEQLTSLPKPSPTPATFTVESEAQFPMTFGNSVAQTAEQLGRSLLNPFSKANYNFNPLDPLGLQNSLMEFTNSLNNEIERRKRNLQYFKIPSSKNPNPFQDYLRRFL